MLARYLLTFSYLGTKYRGIQRLSNEFDAKQETIQSAIEFALKYLRPRNEPKLVLSSRTDKGVHAIVNTAHVDLVHRLENYIYQPSHVTEVLNQSFQKLGHEIIIRDTSFVPLTFHARHSAKQRAYRYRLAIVKKDSLGNAPALKHILYPLLPLTEINRCHVVGPHLDIDKVHEAIALFIGDHDFATFHSKSNQAIRPITVRSIEQFLFYPLDPDPAGIEDECYKNVEMWEFYIQSRSFLYNQVRKMIAAILAVGEGTLALDDVRWMLDNPSTQNWKGKVQFAPAHALYLAKIEYDEEDLQLTPDDLKTFSQMEMDHLSILNTIISSDDENEVYEE